MGSRASIRYKPAREDMRDMVAVCKADFDKLRAAATEQVEASRHPAPHPWTAQAAVAQDIFPSHSVGTKGRHAPSLASLGGDSPHLWSPQAWLMRQGWDSALYSMASSKWSVCRADAPPFGPSSA